MGRIGRVFVTKDGKKVIVVIDGTGKYIECDLLGATELRDALTKALESAQDEIKAKA
jgi:hypothetical protein